MSQAPNTWQLCLTIDKRRVESSGCTANLPDSDIENATENAKVRGALLRRWTLSELNKQQIKPVAVSGAPVASLRWRSTADCGLLACYSSVSLQGSGCDLSLWQAVAAVAISSYYRLTAPAAAAVGPPLCGHSSSPFMIGPHTEPAIINTIVCQ